MKLIKVRINNPEWLTRDEVSSAQLVIQQLLRSIRLCKYVSITETDNCNYFVVSFDGDKSLFLKTNAIGCRIARKISNGSNITCEQYQSESVE